MSPDEMKQLWQQMNANPQYDSKDSAALIDGVTSGRITSARDQLMRRYRMMSAIVCPIGIFASIPLWHEMVWWQILYLVLFFIVAAAMDIWLYRGIKSIDLTREGVQRVSERVRYYRKWHLTFQAILIPFSAGLVMVYFSLYDDPFYRNTLWFGLAIGLIFGFIVWLQMMRAYKKML